MVTLRKFPVVKETLKGVQIEYFGELKFVRLKARKHFACITKREALISFIARKTLQLKILKNNIDVNTIALERAIELKRKQDEKTP